MIGVKDRWDILKWMITGSLNITAPRWWIDPHQKSPASLFLKYKDTLTLMIHDLNIDSFVWECEPQLRRARPAPQVTWVEQVSLSRSPEPDVKSGSRGAARAGQQKGPGPKVDQNLNIHQESSGSLFYLSRRSLQVADGQERFPEDTICNKPASRAKCNIPKPHWRSSATSGTCTGVIKGLYSLARHKVGAALQYFNCCSNDDSKLSQATPAQLRAVHASFPDR